MTRRWWWTVAVVAVLAQCWVVLDARQVLPYEGGIVLVLALVAVGVSIIRRRWRRRPVSDGSRSGRDELIGLHDALVVRLPIRDGAPSGAGQVAGVVEFHGDPQGDLTAGGAQRPVDRRGDR